MKKWSPKLKSTRKTEQDRHCRKFWLLVKGQRKKSKSKSTGLGSKSTDTGPGRVMGQAADPLTSSYDVSLTWTCLRVCWRGVMTSSTDIRWHQQQSSARVRRVLSPPAREEDAKNPGGAWRRVRRRMTTRFSGQVDQWTTRPSGWRVYLEDDLEVRNLRRCVVIFRG